MADRDLNESLLKIMAYVAAPLNSQTVLNNLMDLESDDFSLDLFGEELSFFTTYTTEGLRAFTDCFDLLRSDKKSFRPNPSPATDNKYGVSPACDVPTSSQLSLLAYMLPFFLKRVARLAQALNKVADVSRERELGSRVLPEMTDELRRLISAVNDNVRPDDPTVATTLDMTHGLPWNMPDIHQKVSIKWKKDAIEINEEGKAIEAPVRSTSEFGGRRKQRNPTGYIKFNMSDLGDIDATDDSDAPSSADLRKQRSSFDDDKTVEINDPQADPNWHDPKRISVREARVRKRIPTGHPKLMKTALLARESLEMGNSESDEELKRNTSANER